MNHEHGWDIDSSVQRLVHSSVELARYCLGMDVAFVGEFRDGRRVFRDVAASPGWDVIKPGDSDPLDESYCQHIVSGRIPDIVLDSLALPMLAGLSVTQLLSIRAYLGVPIRLSDGSLFGTFCCFSHSARAKVRESDRVALRHFADLIGEMLEERILREREFRHKCARLNAAIDDHAVSIEYQPIVELASGEAVGYEALARFATAPERAPDQWFADAHAVQRGPELERMAIELALSGMDQLEPDTYLAVNVSAHALVSDSIHECLEAAPSGKVVVEVTEHVPVEEYRPLQACLARLRTHGVRLAIDDAGSGYASFRHILQLKPEIIKLDQSLIRDIDTDHDRRALAVALIKFAQETNAGIVAEGVETAGECSTLRSLGVKNAQGFFFSRADGQRRHA
ncbi:MAG TPA: EAL domain-containing protein [Telluria sp.]|nr:EAL domain-containing protein [Telluria sp.]